MTDARSKNVVVTAEYTENSTQHTSDTVLIEVHASSPQSTAEPDLTFAKLVPINPLAKAAFLEVARLVEQEKSRWPQLREFVHVHSTPPATAGDDDNSAQSADEQDDEWPGYYRLSLGVLPQAWNLGWVIGSGIEHLPNRAVDLLLTLNGSAQGVRGRHARLRPNLDSGALMLIADKGKMVYLNGQPIRGEAMMVNRMVSALNFGDLAYSLQFTRLNDRMFKENLEILKKTLGGYHTPMFSSLQATPSERHFELQGYEIQAPVGSGTYGMVSPCRRLSDGNAFAAKCVRRSVRSMKDIKKEIDVYRRIGEHENLCRLIEVLYSGGHENVMGATGVDNIYIIHAPLCDGSFRAFIGSSADNQERTLAFAQIANGLAHLHDQRIMHRDIKPGNMMIATRDPLRVVIIDYGHATIERRSIDHFKGTIAYLAPEILALKSGDSVIPYDQSCDMWALGLVGYQLFRRTMDPTWKGGVGPETHRRILATVSLFDPVICEMLRGLLEWQASSRLKAAALVDALTLALDD